MSSNLRFTITNLSTLCVTADNVCIKEMSEWWRWSHSFKIYVRHNELVDRYSISVIHMMTCMFKLSLPQSSWRLHIDFTCHRVCTAMSNMIEATHLDAYSDGAYNINLDYRLISCAKYVISMLFFCFLFV